jgi:hypothetical protein
VLRGRRAAIAAAFLTAAAAAVSSGCGGGSTSNAVSLDPVAAAATKSQHAGAARIRLALAITGPGTRGKSIPLHASGAIDGTSSELTVELGSLIRQTGIPHGVSPTAAMSQLTHARMKVVSLEQHGDYVIYVRLGVLASQLPGGQHWFKLDISKLGKSSGVDLGKLLSGSQLQPGDLLGLLRREGATVHRLGSAMVDGTVTTHYRVTIDVAEALESKGFASPLLGSFAAQTPKLPEDVWIGKDGLVRRIGFKYGLAEAGKRLGLRMTMDISDYGAHVTIAAPPSNDVFDATQLARGGLGNGFLH